MYNFIYKGIKGKKGIVENIKVYKGYILKILMPEKQETKQKQYNEGKISIMITIDTWNNIKKLKVHERQTFNEVVSNLVDKELKRSDRKHK